MSDRIQPDLERDILASDWMRKKICDSDVYAQNLYASLCNNEFQYQDVWSLLRNDLWSCTWRYAGGIIARARGHGDYIDFYCSGMTFYTDSDKDWQSGYVPEGMVVDEIRDDLRRLQWTVCEKKDTL